MPVELFFGYLFRSTFTSPYGDSSIRSRLSIAYLIMVEMANESTCTVQKGLVSAKTIKLIVKMVCDD